MLYPFFEYWYYYVLLVVLLIISLGIDLLLGRRDKASSYRFALIRVSIYTCLGIGLSAMIYLDTYVIHDAALARKMMFEYLAVYIVELSLSIDNLFVFIVIFHFFRIQSTDQRLILIYGILGAVLMRGLFIAVGSQLVQYVFMQIVFGLFLIFTGIRLLREQDEKKDLSHNIVYNYLQKHLPLTKRKIPGKFFIRENGKWVGTSLFLALILVEFSDLIFAVDSVPAALAISQEPFIVFSANVMALLGLRSLFVIVNQLLNSLRFLKHGLSVILIFIGSKMAWYDQYFEHHFPVTISIIVIIVVIAISVFASLLYPLPKKTKSSKTKKRQIPRKTKKR